MKLSTDQIAFLKAFSKSCRRSILEMVTQAQSGHPGGSLSCIDYLSLLYVLRLHQSNEPIVVSNGHISPAVYSVLAELGVIPKARVIETFRKPVDIYEGHVNRQVQGVWYGTGPLAVGASAAAGMALGEKLKVLGSGEEEAKHVFLLMGDGENQEGQAYEMMNFAVKHRLDNLILFVDFNQVQLTASLDEIMPLQVKKHYEAAGWFVQEVDGHDFEAMNSALEAALDEKGRPSVLIGHTIMGQGVEFMAKTGREYKADWHGKAPKKDEAAAALMEMILDEEEAAILAKGLEGLTVNIKTPVQPEVAAVNGGTPRVYGPEEMTDCRSAYGAALVDLASLNPHILALTADLADSVKTDGVKKAFPDRHIECGIAEQHMVSCSGGLSILGFVPFCSTFGAFMSSRAKDQARVNDINQTNVKMVATHCGLSVGEDGPTHQAIDDISSFAGFFHTNIFEPADPNQCDRIVRFVAAQYGNFYVRMGRAKIPVLTKEDGSPFFGEGYDFIPGRADILRQGKRATIVASGPMVHYALKAAENLGGDIEILVVSSFIPFDAESVVASARKTGRVVTVHDHNIDTGLGSFVQEALFEAGVMVPVQRLGVSGYQLSGTADELYEKAGLSVRHIEEALKKLI
ncbi:MAG: transketolase [Candidatus Gracilibacteria bacterium]|jgi:transketolase